MKTRMVVRVDKEGALTLGGALGMLLQAISTGAPTDAEISLVRHRSGGIAEIAVDWPTTSEARSPEISAAAQSLAASLLKAQASAAPGAPTPLAQRPRNATPPPKDAPKEPAKATTE